MLCAVLAVTVPLLSVVSSSLVSAKELASRSYIIIPDKIDLTAYKALLGKTGVFFDAFKITLFRVVAGTAINLVFTYLTAYAMSKKELPGRNFITIFFFFTMLFNGGMIPTYIVVKEVGLLNSIWVYILPGLISVWYTLLMRNFIMNIPDGLIESAEIDGASDLLIIFRIILPLSLPALAAIGLFYAVDHWNSWFDAYLYVTDTKKQPVQLLLRNILAQSEIRFSTLTGSVSGTEVAPPARSVRNAAVIITTLPILFVYPFIQKYFIKGIMIGAIKG